MAGINGALTPPKGNVARKATGATTIATNNVATGGGAPVNPGSSDGVSLGSGLTPEMQSMNNLRDMARRMPTLSDIRHNRRMDAQGECVRASGKSGDEIKSMSKETFSQFQTNISMCTDTRMGIQEMSRMREAPKRNPELQQKIHDLIMN